MVTGGREPKTKAVNSRNQFVVWEGRPPTPNFKNFSKRDQRVSLAATPESSYSLEHLPLQIRNKSGF